MIVDTFIEDWGLVLEVDGRRYHTRKADFERDRRRDNAAVALGFVVVRFTWHMIVNEFDYCLDTLLTTGRRRATSPLPVSTTTPQVDVSTGNMDAH